MSFLILSCTLMYLFKINIHSFPRLRIQQGRYNGTGILKLTAKLNLKWSSFNWLVWFKCYICLNQLLSETTRLLLAYYSRWSEIIHYVLFMLCFHPDCIRCLHVTFEPGLSIVTFFCVYRYHILVFKLYHLNVISVKIVFIYLFGLPDLGLMKFCLDSLN